MHKGEVKQHSGDGDSKEETGGEVVGLEREGSLKSSKKLEDEVCKKTKTEQAKAKAGKPTLRNRAGRKANLIQEPEKKLENVDMKLDEEGASRVVKGMRGLSGKRRGRSANPRVA